MQHFRTLVAARVAHTLTGEDNLFQEVVFSRELKVTLQFLNVTFYLCAVCRKYIIHN